MDQALIFTNAMHCITHQLIIGGRGIASGGLFFLTVTHAAQTFRTQDLRIEALARSADELAEQARREDVGAHRLEPAGQAREGRRGGRRQVVVRQHHDGSPGAQQRLDPHLDAPGRPRPRLDHVEARALPRAFDQRTGKILWQMKLPAAGYATPSTYMVNGKQFIVIACGGGKCGTKSGDAYVAFALPKN
jgi:hypothetical protein